MDIRPQTSPFSEKRADPVAAIRSFASEIGAHFDAFDSGRALPPGLAAALAEAGFFRMLTPKALGGWELDLVSVLETIEAAAELEGAVGWSLMIGNGGGFAGALPEAGSKAIFGCDPNTIACGALAPLGRAEAVEGGFKVEGRWPFVSGCTHATWLGNGCVVFENGKPRLREDGAPDTRILFFPKGDFTIHDTWNVTGLRGTGSHDVSVTDVFVPETHAFAFPPRPDTRPTFPGPLYAFPVRSLIAATVAAIPLGLARHALNETMALVAKKRPFAATRTLAESPVAQSEVARAEAILEGARLLFYTRVKHMWDRVSAGEKPDLRERALLLGAVGHAARSAAEVVNLMHGLAGTTGIYVSHPLERVFRDITVATKHMSLAPARSETAGAVLLGQAPAPGAFV